MRNVNHKELKDLIKIYCKHKRGLMVWGPPGVGKSATVEDVARELAKENKLEFSKDAGDVNNEKKFVLIDQRAAQFDSSDIRGLPHFNGEQKTTWFLPSYLPREGSGILLFDEVNLAAPLVQGSLYELLYDRRLVGGQYKLPEGYGIICAGNRLEDRANVFEMAAPLCNRIGHVELSIPDVELWSNWAMEHDLDARIIAFLNARKSLIFKFDEKMKDKAFPTPRTNAMVGEMIKGVTNLDEVEVIATSLIGEGAGLEFVGFIKLQRKVNLKEILKNPESVEKIKDIDLKYSLTSLIAETFKTDKTILEPVLNVCKYLEPEFAILTLRFIKNIVGVKFIINQLPKVAVWKNELQKQYATLLLGE